MKYLYDKDLIIVGSYFDEIENKDILATLNGEQGYILNEVIEYAKLDNGNIVAMNEEEIARSKYLRYQNGLYTPKDNEIIQENTIIEVVLEKGYKVVDHSLVYDMQQVKSEILEKANKLKNTVGDYGFIFKDNLRQPCREQDKTSVTAKVLELQLTKQNTTEWKFFDKDTNEHIYRIINTKELIEIGIHIGHTILQAMKSESRVINDMKDISEEDLKNYDVNKKFEEYMKS